MSLSGLRRCEVDSPALLLLLRIPRLVIVRLAARSCSCSAPLRSCSAPRVSCRCVWLIGAEVRKQGCGHLLIIGWEITIETLGREVGGGGGRGK